MNPTNIYKTTSEAKKAYKNFMFPCAGGKELTDKEIAVILKHRLTGINTEATQKKAQRDYYNKHKLEIQERRKEYNQNYYCTHKYEILKAKNNYLKKKNGV